MFAVAVIAFLTVLLSADEALAWGPATHLELGREVLGNLGLIAAPVRPLLERFPYDFLYGNISADIVVGKNLVEELKHCHNWRIGFRLLKKTHSDSQRAFAYGYLCHLAADTVAHNLFIPEMMIRSFKTRMLRHIYWELRFDALADKRVWRLPEKIGRSMNGDNDRLLESLFEDTPFSFKTNKRIFSGMINLHKIERWHRMMGLISKTSKWTIDGADKRRYFDLAMDAVQAVLRDGEHACCTAVDPTGRLSIHSAKTARRRLKAMRRYGLDWEKEMDRALAELSPPPARTVNE
ncbi:MAG TPA: hypothetical protein ENJ37_03075 [Deltaproteobacteria bacterium]|nr:hypothetical protein [Deltaproteobacteria bacterium]